MSKNLPRDDVGEVNNIQLNVKCQYFWKIKNFSNIMYTQEMGVFKSPMISTKTKPEYHFKFVILSRSLKMGNLSMALRCYNDTALEIQCSFSIVNSNYKQTSSAVYNLNNLGWSIKMCKMNEVEKFLINDEITILCEIEIDMNSKYNKQTSDVNIIIDDYTFFVHKNILANSSKVFAAMFEHDMKENQENLIEIEDITWSIFNILLQYVYNKRDNCDADDRIELLAAADKYAIEELKNICENKLCENITLTNVFEYLKVADMYILNKLKKETIDFIKSHKSQLVEKKLMHFVADLPKDLLIEVVSVM